MNTSRAVTKLLVTMAIRETMYCFNTFPLAEMSSVDDVYCNCLFNIRIYFIFLALEGVLEVKGNWQSNLRDIGLVKIQSILGIWLCMVIKGFLNMGEFW